MLYYFEGSGDPKGPYTMEQLNSLFDRGEITGNTLVAAAGDSGWKAWSEISGSSSLPPLATDESVTTADFDELNSIVIENQIIGERTSELNFPKLCPVCSTPADSMVSVQAVNCTQDHTIDKPEQMGQTYFKVYMHEPCKLQSAKRTKLRFWIPRISSGFIFMLCLAVGIYYGSTPSSFLYKCAVLLIGAVLMTVAWVVSLLFLPDAPFEVQFNDESVIVVSNNKRYLENLLALNSSFKRRTL